MESGEYFLTKEEKNFKKKEKKDNQVVKKTKERIQGKNEKYVAPSENEGSLGKRAKPNNDVSLDDMKKKFGIKDSKLKL